jgi:hypothetical protein
MQQSVDAGAFGDASLTAAASVTARIRGVRFSAARLRLAKQADNEVNSNKKIDFIDACICF